MTWRMLEDIPELSDKDLRYIKNYLVNKRIQRRGQDSIWLDTEVARFNDSIIEFQDTEGTFRQWRARSRRDWFYSNIRVKQEETEDMKLINVLQLGDVVLELTQEQTDILKKSPEGILLLDSKEVQPVKVRKVLKAGDELMSLTSFDLELTKVPEGTP